METPLDLLMKATHYVENQQRSANLGNGNRSSNTPTLKNEERPIKENGHADPAASPHLKPTKPAQELVSQHAQQKQQNSIRRTSAQDESGIDRKRESMRFSEVGRSDETANMSQFNRNGMLRMYGVDDKVASAYRATDSPLKSSPRKRSSSPSSRVENEQPAKMHMSQALNPLLATQPVGQLPAANPVMPFVHPLYSTLDSALYMEAIARQANSDASRPGASPASTSTTQAVNDAITSQGLSRLMYPAQNSAMFMAQRAPTAPGFVLPEMPMVVPSHLAAYGQTAGLLPQQLAALSAVPDAEKRIMMEGLTAAGFSPQHLQAQWLASPYFKNILSAPNSELAAGKDASRSVPKPTVPTAVGLSSFPLGYPADSLLKYPESISAELLKHQERTLASQAMSPGVSPEAAKKAGLPNHPSAPLIPSDVLTASSLQKPSIMDWKIPSTSARPLKHEGGQMRFDTRPTVPTSRRDQAFSENHADMQSKADESSHKLAAGLTQRPASGADGYTARYNSHERQSPSPYGLYRRRSFDFSPHLSPNTGEKAAKKRPEFGIPRDLIPPELKNHSPSTQATLGTLRQSKSPQRSVRSPMEHPAVPSAASGLFASFAGKANPAAGDKDNPAALYPYMLHPAFGGGYTLPFALPAAAPYLCQPDLNVHGTNKAFTDALAAAAAQANAVNPSLFRAQLPQETSLPADLAARWSALSPYVPFLQQQQQQQLQQALKAFSTTSTATADYASAVALKLHPQTLLLDGRDKDRVASPSHPALASTRRFMPSTSMSPAPKVARASPVMGASTANLKNPTQGLNHLYRPRSGSPIRGPDVRAVKRETSPPGSKRTIPSAMSPHGFQKNSISNIRMSEEERNRLKRKIEDSNERNFPKEALKQRKRDLTTSSVNDVDEHFRRSLGSKYKESDGQNKVLSTASPDDHFKKALGNDLWSKFKTTKDSGSPAVTDPLSNGRDARSIPAGLHPGPQYPLFYASVPGVTPDSRAFASLPHAHAMASMSAARTVKAGPTVYPELKTNTTLASMPSIPGKSDSTKRLPFAESRPQPPPTYDSVARRPNDSQEASVRRASSSPNDKGKKSNFSQNSSPRSNSSQNSGDRLTAPVTESPCPRAAQPSPLSQSTHTITNGFSASPTRFPPPAYSPSSAQSLPPTSTPAHSGSVDRQPSEDSNKSAPPMSVQT